MSKDPRDEALDIIHELTANLLLRDDLPFEVNHDLELILSLARHKFDLLTDEDRERVANLRQLRRQTRELRPNIDLR